MSLVHGRRIEAEELERVVSRQFSPDEFSSLCNAVAWSAAGKRCSQLPSFTERQNVKDGGIDAEWSTELAGNEDHQSPLLGPGWNVFQYKKRDIFAQDRKRVFSNLKVGVAGAVKELHERTARRVDRYVLFTNLDLTHYTEAERASAPQKGELRDAVLAGYDKPEQVHVEIVGAAELASLLNDLPHLRSAFFSPERFATWKRSWDDFRIQKTVIFGDFVSLVGREKDLEDLRSLVDDSQVRAIVIAAPHNMGKTRLALEATSHRPIETVVALDPYSLTVSDFLAIETPATEIVVIIEDPDPKKAQALVDQAMVHGGLKLLITFPTVEDAPTPGFGRDDRVRILKLMPLTNPASWDLVKAAGGEIDFGLESWLVEQAGGNPGILLLATKLGPALRREAMSLAEDVAGELTRKVCSELGKEAVEMLAIFSILTRVGYKNSVSHELQSVCSALVSPMNSALNCIPRLTSAGFLQKRGSYVEVVPPILANWLAMCSLRGRYSGLCTLFFHLSRSGQLRLLERLRNLKSDETSRFWSELFGTGGLMKDFSYALDNADIFGAVAGSVPVRAVTLIKYGLEAMDVEARRSIEGKKRRELIRTIEELLFRKKTCADAIRCLALLAEAESEKIGNNATGIFSECFIPWHSQVPLYLQQRLDLLNEILSANNSTKIKQIVLQAVKQGIYRMQSMSLRKGTGPEPLDTRPRITYGDLYQYLDQLMELLMRLAQDEDREVVASAAKALPQTLCEYGQQVPTKLVMSKLKTVTDWAMTQEVPVPTFEFAESLRLLLNNFEDRKTACEPEMVNELERNIDEVKELQDRVDKGDFQTRLRRWIGGWPRDRMRFEVNESGRSVYKVDSEIALLAKEALDKPEVLTEDLIEWLCSQEAQRPQMFWHELGRIDLKKRWLERVENIGTEEKGLTVLASYLGGLAEREPEFVSNRLDELVEEGRIKGEAIVGATSYLGGNLAGVERVEKLISRNRVDPVYVERILKCGRWISSLKPEEYLRLLKSVAGSNLEHPDAVLDFMPMWLLEKKPLERELAELAWKCLETAAPSLADFAYSCDQIAATLFPADKDRGFRLLDKLLSHLDADKTWNPIKHYGHSEFWRALKAADSKRTIGITLDQISTSSMQRIHLTFDLSKALNLEEDADALIEYAYESESQAELVSQCLTRGPTKFWTIAFKIIEKYPSSERIKANLAAGVEQMGQVVNGPRSRHLEECRQEVERVLKDPATPSFALPWLEELETNLRKMAASEGIFEIDEENEWL